MIEDWLMVGRLIGARLRDKIPELTEVQQVVSIAAIEDLTPAVPAVLIMWDGDDVAETSSTGAAQVIWQRWLAVLTVRSAAHSNTGGGIIHEAGPYLSRMIGALNGWQPSGLTRPLARVSGLKPGFVAGYGYYPLTYKAAVVARADKPKR